MKHHYVGTVVCSLIFLLPVLHASSQNHIRWGELQNERHRYSLDLSYLGPCSSLKTYVWLKSHKEGWSLEHVNGSLVPVHSYPLPLDSLLPEMKRKTLRCHVVSFHRDTLNLLVIYKGEHQQVFAQALQFNVQGRITKPPVTLYLGSKREYYKLALNSDSTCFALLKITETDKKNLLQFKMYNRNLEQVSVYNTELESQDEDHDSFVISDFRIDAEQNFVLAKELYSKHSSITDKSFCLIKPREGIVKDFLPQLGDCTIESFALESTPKGVVVTGLYFLNDVVPNVKSPSRLFYFEINDQMESIQHLQTYPCSLAPVTDENTDHYFFPADFSYAIAKKMGGVFLFIERAVIEKKTGRMHVTTLGVANFDELGQLNAFSTVARNQSYLFGPYAHAYSTLPVYDSPSKMLYLIFNDYESNLTLNEQKRVVRSMKKSLPVIVAIDERGKMEKRVLEHRTKEAPVVSIAWSHAVKDHEVIMIGAEPDGYRMGWLNIEEVRGKTVANRVSVAPVHTAPRRTTYHAPAADQFTKTTPRRFDGFLGGTFGTASRLPQSTNDWLTQKGYPTQFGLPGLDSKFTLMARFGPGLWGMDIGSTYFDSNGINYNELRGALGFGEALYVPKISSFAVFAIHVGFAFQDITFSNQPHPNNPQTLSTFHLQNESTTYISPSVRLFKRTIKGFTVHDRNGTLRAGWALGLEVGARFYFSNAPWHFYENNKQFPGGESMPRISGVSFYLNVPVGRMWEMFDATKRR